MNSLKLPLALVIGGGLAGLFAVQGYTDGAVWTIIAVIIGELFNIEKRLSIIEEKLNLKSKGEEK